MKITVEKITVSVVFDLTNDTDDFLTQIADGFAKIQRNDIRVYQIACNSKTKKIVEDADKKYLWSKNNTLWGADYLINESIQDQMVILSGDANK